MCDFGKHRRARKVVKRTLVTHYMAQDTSPANQDYGVLWRCQPQEDARDQEDGNSTASADVTKQQVFTTLPRKMRTAQSLHTLAG
jgi:hypothetical protein